MAATLTLLAKELRQHAAALGGLPAPPALAWVVALAAPGPEERTVSALEVLARFLGAPLVAAALYLAHRLVVAEHYGRTQRFVEALPVRRWHMGAVKAAFGLAWLLAWGL